MKLRPLVLLTSLILLWTSNVYWAWRLWDLGEIYEATVRMASVTLHEICTIDNMEKVWIWLIKNIGMSDSRLSAEGYYWAQEQWSRVVYYILRDESWPLVTNYRIRYDCTIKRGTQLFNTWTEWSNPTFVDSSKWLFLSRKVELSSAILKLKYVLVRSLWWWVSITELDLASPSAIKWYSDLLSNSLRRSRENIPLLDAVIDANMSIVQMQVSLDQLYDKTNNDLTQYAVWSLWWLAALMPWKDKWTIMFSNWFWIKSKDGSSIPYLLSIEVAEFDPVKMIVYPSKKWLDSGIIDWANKKWLTSATIHQLQRFASDNQLTREQAAKFFGKYAVNVLWMKPDTTKSCAFKDINLADKTLVNDIKLSCQLWIFNWKSGIFNPKWKLLFEDAVSVAMRAAYWTKDWKEDGAWKKRYSPHITAANSLNIMPYLEERSMLNKPVTRSFVLEMLYNIAEKLKKI